MNAQQRPAFLVSENVRFAGTGGVSEHNAHHRFVPAFKDCCTGQVEIARYRDGRPAPFHIVDGLPEDWVLNRGADGRALAIKSTIVSGFVRLGRFFTRQEASDYLTQMSS